VVVTTDDTRREWSSTLLRYMGHSLFSMEELFNHAPGSEAVDLVLVDPQCMTAAKFTQLMTFLSSLEAGICLLTDYGAAVPPAAEGLPRLPVIFSGKQLEKILVALPV